MKRVTAFLAATATILVGASAMAAPDANRPPWTKNCTALNKKYPHGVGKANARDRTTSGAPVTTFKRSTKLYNVAMSWNRGLDRDKDGVACEKD